MCPCSAASWVILLLAGCMPAATAGWLHASCCCGYCWLATCLRLILMVQHPPQHKKKCKANITKNKMQGQ
jgi:hypothetical protein